MLVTGVVAAMLLATGHAALSQTPRLQLAIGGGIATDARGVTSRAATIAPSLAWIADSRLSFGIGANATRFQDEQWSLGASGMTSGRLPLGALAALTFDGSAATTITSYDAAYRIVDAIPAVELHAGPLTAFAGAHAAWARSSLTTQGAAPFGVLPGAQGTAATTRTALGALVGGNARLTSGGEVLVVGYREEHAAVLHVPFVDRAATASISAGALTIAGSVGRRAAPDDRTSFGSGSLSLALSHATALDVEGGTYPANRVTGLPGGRYFSVGLSFGAGSRPASARAEAPLPAPGGVRPPLPGYTRLAIHDADAKRVDLAGDFDGWKPMRAMRSPDGTWYVDLKLAPGRYRYAFRVDGTTWRVPDGAAAVDDGFGGKSAWLTIGGPDAAGSHDTTEE